MRLSDAGDSVARPRSSFFASPWPWLAHAAGWIVLLFAANAVLPLLYLGPPLVALAVVAAFVSSRLLGDTRIEVRAEDVVRFALVDAVLCGTVVLSLLPIAGALLQLLGGSGASRAVGPGLATIAGAFVPLFYASLAGIAALERRPGAWRRAPALLAAAAVLALLAVFLRPAAGFIGRNKALAGKIAAYEAETGKSGKAALIDISLSLHGFNSRSFALAAGADGRVAVAGMFTFYGGHDAAGLALLEPDGRLDGAATSAAAAAVGGRSIVSAHALADGSVLVGLSDGLAGPPTLHRLLADGTLAALPPGVLLGGDGYDPVNSAFDVRADGSFLVGGGQPRLPGDPPRCVRRILPSGEADTAFAAAVGASFDWGSDDRRLCGVTALHALPDGGALVVLSGPFGADPSSYGQVRRLDAEGRLDAEFTPDVEGTRDVAIGPSGEIFVVTLPRTGSTYTLTKLRADGARDASFAPPTDLPLGQALVVQNDGALLTAGYGARSGGVARVLADGRLDSAFGDGGYVNLTGFIIAIVPVAGGEIYLLGEFFDVSARGRSLERYNIARLLADGTPDASFDPR